MGVFLFSNRSIDTATVGEVLASRGHKSIAVENREQPVQKLVHASKVLVDNKNYLNANQLGGVNSADYDLWRRSIEIGVRKS